MKIVQEKFGPDQYFRVQTLKSQICLHHTVSPNSNCLGDISWWISESSRIGTPYIISGDGVVHQLFDEKYWIHHLGVSMKSNRIVSKYKNQSHNILLNKAAIGVEIDSAGGLKWRNGAWFSSFGTKIPEKNVTKYDKPFRGYEAFESYTDAQIQALKELLLMLSKKYSIPLDYHDDIWDINERALKGTPGLYTHVSYRTDKSDCHPQESLIQMLKSLTIQ